MGACCQGKRKIETRLYAQHKLLKAIEKNELEAVREVLHTYIRVYQRNQKQPLLDLEEPIISYNGIGLNALAYCLQLGRANIFQYLHEVAEQKIIIMANMFDQLNTRPIEILCQQGHLQLLKYYLPIYIQGKDRLPPMINESYSEELSIFMSSKRNFTSTIERSRQVYPGSPYTPLQLACEASQTKVVKFLYRYFQNKEPPQEFSVHHICEVTGENCALIAVRHANIELIRFLNEQCNADFTIFNKRKENCLQIAIVGQKHRPNMNYLECVQYLVEIVGIDIMYEYEETLLLCDSSKILQYLTLKYRELGVRASKEIVEEKYTIKNHERPRLPTYMEEKLNRVKGPRFSFIDLFREELEDSIHKVGFSTHQKSPSEISSITVRQEYPTPQELQGRFQHELDEAFNYNNQKSNFDMQQWLCLRKLYLFREMPSNMCVNDDKSFQKMLDQTDAILFVLFSHNNRLLNANC